MDDLWLFFAVGFLAQLIDGTLGMAYGVTSNSFLLAAGLPPAIASSTVHAAECCTTGVSALCHRWRRNIDPVVFWKLMPAGVVAGVLGAYVLTSIDGNLLKPWITGYLMLMGLVILYRVFQAPVQRRVTTWLQPLGFVGAFLDALGGGGWGPVVTSTLVARGNGVRYTIGSVNSAEFFVTVAMSITFILTLGLDHWPIIVALGAGGVLAAPLGAWTCSRLPHRPLMAGVGVLVILTAGRTLFKWLGWI